MSTLALQSLVDDLTARIQALGAERDDLIILTSFMVGDDWTAEAIALAVEKPWKYVDVLAEAKADLIGRGPVEDPKPCPTCDGCGMIANTEAGEPWTAWADLQPPSNIAVVMGLVQPIPCPACSQAPVTA